MSTHPEERKLAAIIFTDMVGYSALSQRDDKFVAATSDPLPARA